MNPRDRYTAEQTLNHVWIINKAPKATGAKLAENMVDNLRRGDQVLTQGGIIGKITKVKEGEEIEVELAKDVKVSVIRSTIVNVLSKTEPAKK